MPINFKQPVDVQDLLFARFERNAWDATNGRYDCWTIGQELYQRYGLALPTREDLALTLADAVKDPQGPRLFQCLWHQHQDRPLPVTLPALSCLLFEMLPLHVGWVIWNGIDFLHIQEDTRTSIEPIHSPTWKRKLIAVYAYQEPVCPSA